MHFEVSALRCVDPSKCEVPRVEAFKVTVQVLLLGLPTLHHCHEPIDTRIVFNWQSGNLD